MPSSAPSLSATTDLKLLESLGVWQQGFISLLMLSAGLDLASRISSPLAHTLPGSFTGMRAGLDILILLCAASLHLTQPQRSRKSISASRVLGFIVAVIAANIVFDHLGLFSLHTLVATSVFSTTFFTVSIEAAWTFLLTGLVLTHLRIRQGLLARLMDALTLGLGLLLLTFLAQYVVGLNHLRSFAAGRPFTLEAFLCLSILTLLVVTRRAEYGMFSILFDSGIGGKTARIASPCAIILPFVFALAKEIPVRLNLVLESSVAAASTAILSVLAFSLVIGFARHTNKLEVATRELSLRDELTRLYNRRGFYVLGEQGIRLAQRAQQPFFVLFIDVDNLKVINDSMGHEIGSSLLQEMADLLTSTFRGQDIIARLGGDEFVVAGNAVVTDISAAITRLEAAAWTANAACLRPYHLSYSLGLSMSGPRCAESLDTLLERADKTMYDAKRARKQLGATPTPVLTMA